MKNYASYFCLLLFTLFVSLQYACDVDVPETDETPPTATISIIDGNITHSFTSKNIDSIPDTPITVYADSVFVVGSITDLGGVAYMRFAANNAQPIGEFITSFADSIGLADTLSLDTLVGVTINETSVVYEKNVEEEEAKSAIFFFGAFVPADETDVLSIELKGYDFGGESGNENTVSLPTIDLWFEQ